MQDVRQAFQKAAQKLRLSDKHLDFTIRWSRRLALFSAGGLVLWGGVAAVGGIALGLKAAGVGVPAILGVTTVMTGSAMAAKALVQRHLFKTVHKKGVSARDNRIRKGEYTLPLPAPHGEPPKLEAAFNPRALLSRLQKVLPQGQPKQKPPPPVPG